MLAQPDSAWYRLRKPAQRNRLAVGVGLAVGIAILGGAGVALWQAIQARAEQRRAETVKSFVTGLLTDTDPFNTTSGEATVQSLLTAAQARLPPAEPHNAALRVELLHVIGSSLIGLSKFDSAQTALQQAIDEGRSQLGPNHPLTLSARVTMTSVRRFRGQQAQMQAELDALLPVLRAQPGPGSAELLAAVGNNAHLAIDQGRYSDARTSAREALAMAERRHGREHAVTAEAALVVTLTDHYAGDADQTLASAARARDLLMQVHGPQRPHAKVLDGRFMFGRALGNVGRFEEAVVELVDVLRQVRVLLGGEVQMAGFVAADIGRFALELGDAGSSLEHGRQALAIVSRDAGDATFTVAMARMHVGRALLARHEDEAVRMLSAARDSMLKARGTASPVVADLTALHALALAEQGQIDVAQRILHERLDFYRNAEPLYRYRGLHIAGLVRRRSGDAEAAAALQAEALAALPAHAKRRDGVLAEQARLAVDRGLAAHPSAMDNRWQ